MNLLFAPINLNLKFIEKLYNSNFSFSMKAFFALAIVLCATYIRTEAPALGNYLNAKASDKKFSCLMQALSKIEETSATDNQSSDWSENLQAGVQQGIDVNTVLFQYQYLNISDRNSIKKCSLDLSRATERCKSVYGDCSTVTYNEANSSLDPATAQEVLPYVTRTCPQHYVRYGSSTCMRSCAMYPQIFDLESTDMHQFCYKKAAKVSRLSDKREGDNFEPTSDKYVEKCAQGWLRVGMRLCVPKCPLGWHDHGDKCVKREKINLIAFSWQPGDEA